MFIRQRLLLLGIVVLFAISCSVKTPKSGITLTFMGWGQPIEKKVFDKLIKKFESENPDIHINYMLVPNRDYNSKLLTMLSSDSAPDVFYVIDSEFGGLIKKNILYNITKEVKSSKVLDLSDMWASSVNRYRFDGTSIGQGDSYALPKDIGPVVMFYNKDLFDSAGVSYPPTDRPWTWNEALSAWKKLTKDLDSDGKIDQFGVLYFPFEAAIWSAGGKIIDKKKGQFVLGQYPVNLKTIQWLVDLTYKYHVHPSQSQIASFGSGDVFTVNLFETGKVACFFTGRWMVPNYRKLPFKWDIAEIPVNPITKKSAGWSGSVGLAIWSKSKYKEAAFKFIEFLSGPEGQKAQCKLGFAVPNQISIAKSDIFLQKSQEPEHAEVFLKAAKYEQPTPMGAFPISHIWWDRFWEKMELVWLNKKPVSSVKKISEEVNNILIKQLRGENE